MFKTLLEKVYMRRCWRSWISSTWTSETAADSLTGQLTEKCKNLEKTLHDVDSEDLVLEIRAVIHTFPDSVASSPGRMLDYIYREQLLDLYGNLSIALRLLVRLPVTVASGERSCSALKLIKTYLRSTMSQESLSGLALISIEHNVRRSLDLDNLVTAFAQAKARKHRF